MSSPKHAGARGACLLKIQGGLSGFGHAEKKLADYILAHPQETVRCTIEQLQEHTGSSYATVNRFCRRLGYAGYKDFRNALIESVSTGSSVIEQSTGIAIDNADTIAGIIDKVFSSSAALLQETRAIAVPGACKEAINALRSAGEICFAGTGTSGLVARYAFTRFFRIGLRCSAETDSTLTRQKAALLDKTGVLFAISSSGRSRPTVEAARIAAGRGATVISLCDYAVSPLSRLARINLYTTPRNAGHYIDKEMPLIVGQIALVDVLFAGCCAALAKRCDINALYESTKQAADSEKIDGR